MEKNEGLSIQLAQRVDQMPPDAQGAWRDLVRALEAGHDKRVELALKKATATDVFTMPTPEQAVPVAQFLFLAVRETYARPHTGQFELYTTLLPAFTEFLCRQARHPDLKDHPKLLLTLGDQFALAFHDPAQGRTVAYDNFYEFQMQNVRDFLASPGFKGWRAQPGTDEFLKAIVGRWLVHLGNFARNRREKPFLNLLDTALLLLRTVPELLPQFQPIVLVLPGAKKTFHYLYAEGEDAIAKLLGRAKAASNAELQAVIREWIDLYTIGALPEVPRTGEMEESPDLTVPFVYRSLLEEVLGDGVISAEEEWVVKNMRDFVEISNERYQKIFDQVQEARSLGKLPVLDRDFSPRAFLHRILTKTVEDGVITNDEKALIGQVANALLLDQATLAEVFAQVKEEFKARGGPPPTVGRDLEKLHDLVRYTAMEERIRSVLVSDRGMKIYHKAGKMLAQLRQEAKQRAPDRAAELLGQWPVVCFFFEPQVYLYPVIMLFIESPNVHPARLAFKGGRIDVEFLEEVASRKGEDVWVADRPLIRFVNEGFEAEIPVKGVLVGDSLQNFIEGCREETHGRYAIMIMHHSRMASILALQKAGDLDFSGTFAEARRLLASARHQEAITLLSALRQRSPAMHEIAYWLGVAHEQMLARLPDQTELRARALAFYRQELALNPASDKAMRAIGRLLAEEGQVDEAVTWLRRACEAAPASILNLVTLVEISFKRDLAAGHHLDAPPDYILKTLGEAFHLHPTHPRVRRLVDEFSVRFGLDLAAHFRGQPVATLYQ
ncbi:MAG: hypothetical protein OZSIB_0036 [Candidatus Ozemobacter sibiricus]|uniref:Uncharacterized protein n=1 Tax=Candidatus Ozemobacter sibiricus TaxID=2268124 RepID=A0A367ZMZ1_9BACT|nr:MAG: hypothetical protein OZSIB_0036 [Candidatus Ozemobacter sibiricus]